MEVLYPRCAGLDGHRDTVVACARNRRGPKKAILAVAASMLTAAYFILKRGVPYADLGPDYFDRTDRVRTANRLVRKLSELGFEVKIHQAA